MIACTNSQGTVSIQCVVTSLLAAVPFGLHTDSAGLLQRTRIRAAQCICSCWNRKSSSGDPAAEKSSSDGLLYQRSPSVSPLCSQSFLYMKAFSQQLRRRALGIAQHSGTIVPCATHLALNAAAPLGHLDQRLTVWILLLP